MYAGGQLLSGFDQSDQSIGRFLLVIQSDGNLVSYPTKSEKSGINAYWATGTSGVITTRMVSILTFILILLAV